MILMRILTGKIGKIHSCKMCFRMRPGGSKSSWKFELLLEGGRPAAMRAPTSTLLSFNAAASSVTTSLTIVVYNPFYTQSAAMTTHAQSLHRRQDHTVACICSGSHSPLPTSWDKIACCVLRVLNFKYVRSYMSCESLMAR